ncbi:MAG: hypothetical protein ACLFU8_17245 [Anaerolineales bacterium]
MARHTELGAWGEDLVRRRLATVAPVAAGERADLQVEGIEIEVKTSRPSRADQDRRRPRYQFCLRREGHHTDMHGDVLVLVLAPEGTCYVIPRPEVPRARVLKMGPCTERWEPYREAWWVLADLLEAREFDEVATPLAQPVRG